MRKEKVFIVLSHKHSLQKGSHTGAAKSAEPVWEVTETVEFVNQLRNKHYTSSSAIGDYLNRTMLSGARHGMDNYAKFEEYVGKKYEKQLAELDRAYRSAQVVEEPSPEVVSDQFGNIRPRTVFDAV